MTAETPGCGSTSDARKRNQPDTDPIANVRALSVAAEAKGRPCACLRAAGGARDAATNEGAAMSEHATPTPAAQGLTEDERREAARQIKHWFAGSSFSLAYRAVETLAEGGWLAARQSRDEAAIKAEALREAALSLSKYDAARQRLLDRAARLPDAAAPEGEAVALVARILSECEDPPGWTDDPNGGEGGLVYECACGDMSPVLSDVHIGQADVDAAADWHRRHIAASIAVALTAAPKGVHHRIGSLCTLSDCEQAHDPAPAAGEGVETVERIREAFWRCFQPDFGGYDWRNDAAIQTFARTIAPLLRSPVEPETSEPEGGGSRG